MQKFREQAPHSNDLTHGKLPYGVQQRQMRAHQRNREPTTGQQHGEIFNVATRREKLRLTRIVKSDFV